jgi:hypothetical protein
MGATTGIQAIGSYSAITGTAIDTLLALIPNPDAAHGTGAVADSANRGTNNTYLDEMSPGAAAQLRVELAAMKAAAPGAGLSATGQHVTTAGEATANQLDIVTGLADLTLANCAVSIRRAGTLVDVDAVLSEPTPGTLRVADGSTYNTTAGDVVTWFAK